MSATLCENSIRQNINTTENDCNTRQNMTTKMSQKVATKLAYLLEVLRQCPFGHIRNYNTYVWHTVS